ncbi:MAG TPA: hypothetical protein VFT90_04490 [Chryseosolibacter sp.]|nr:hypothetical protein [Chryseosolibacter sp.]
MIVRFRLPFLLLAALSLIVGLWSGLQRIGWDLNILQASMHHGAIMVGGFLGTLISLEKILPLKHKGLFAIPAMSAAGMVFFLLGYPIVAWSCLLLASMGLSVAFLHYFLREKSLVYLLMLGGGISWLIGNIVLITDRFYPLALPWWLGFALLVITSERVELTKFLPVTRTMKHLLVVLLALYIVGPALSFHGTGSFVSGGALVGVSAWLMRFDLIGISIHREGLTRFVAIALLCGYISMLLTGILILSLDSQPMAYDGVVHVFFIGFVFSMIFAHGPIILPGVLGISAKPYHQFLYVWLATLHASWLMRITADLLLDLNMRKYSGILTTIAIIGYFATIAILTAKNLHKHAKIL